MNIAIVISLAVGVAGCAVLERSQATAAPRFVDVTPELAAVLVDSDPREYFTDYSSPFGCHHTTEQPTKPEPNWVNPATIWPRIRLGYQLDLSLDKKRIDAELNWYHKHPSYMQRVSERANRYIYYVVEQLERHDMPMELALLPIVESAYDPFAYSHGRASGMWQFIPGTGRMYELHQNWWYDGRRDVVASTDAALHYLQKLNNYYDGDWLLALAAYNSGMGNVNKAIRKNKKRGKATDFWALDLPRETRSYVPKLIALARLIDNPQRYGLSLEPIPNQPYFVAVDTYSQIDLAQAAALAKVDIKEIYRLNPAYNRWATSPTGPHRLLIPIEQQALFEQNIAALPADQRLHWQRYTVKNGDSLLLLAKRFKTDVATIREINQIRGNIIRAGQALMIPTASESGQHYSLSADTRLANLQKNRKGEKNSDQVFHQVKSGESLWTISRRYNVSVAKLAHWNGIAPKDPLQPGQKLSVWTKNKPSAHPGERDAIVKKVGYKVRSGDSLALIAGRFNVQVSDIVKWNEVNPRKYLQPGQRLTVYVDIMNAVN